MKRKNRLKVWLIAAAGALILSCVLVFVFPLSRRIRESVLQDRVFRGIAWFRFDKKDALREWEEKIIKGKVLYSVKAGNKDGYLSAYSKGAASAILHWLKFNPQEKPMVSWKWKVIKFPEGKGGAYEAGSWVEKDDYAARFYIIFPKFPFFRLQCLEYIWAKDLPKGAVLTNPDFKNLKIIVAESGGENLGRWVYVERDIYQDFRKAFGRDPGNAGAIAIMTDAENAADTAEAEYDEIKVGYEK